MVNKPLHNFTLNQNKQRVINAAGVPTYGRQQYIFDSFALLTWYIGYKVQVQQRNRHIQHKITNIKNYTTRQKTMEGESDNNYQRYSSPTNAASNNPHHQHATRTKCTNTHDWVHLYVPQVAIVTQVPTTSHPHQRSPCANLMHELRIYNQTQ